MSVKVWRCPKCGKETFKEDPCLYCGYEHKSKRPVVNLKTRHTKQTTLERYLK